MDTIFAAVAKLRQELGLPVKAKRSDYEYANIIGSRSERDLEKRIAYWNESH
jgi:hypothetical protein